MQRRGFIILLGGSAALLPLPLRAQQTASGFQLGYLYPGAPAAVTSRVAAFRSGLQAGGVRADQVSVIVRVADGDLRLLASLAADLVGRKVDLIHATGPAAVRAARAATATVPIVAGDLESDPIGSGFIVSNVRPGGNITGMFLDFPDFSKKWLEALKEAVPQATSVAVFWDSAIGSTQLRAVEAAAPTLGLKLIALDVQKRADFEAALQ
jgi:putative ABC transport system substrate-binding protein